MRYLLISILILFLISYLFLVMTSSDTLSFKDDSWTVDYEDLSHLVLISTMIDGHAKETGMTPENIVDAQGKPLLSWRVAILQYGSDEDVALYKKFKLDEPWDSKHNKEVAKEIPRFYLDPKKTGHTPYLGVAGKTAAFADEPWPVDSTRSQTHAIIVTVDTKKAKVFWTEPRDIPLEKVKESLRWYQDRTRYMDTLGYVNFWEIDGNLPLFEFEEP